LLRNLQGIEPGISKACKFHKKIRSWNIENRDFLSAKLIRDDHNHEVGCVRSEAILKKKRSFSIFQEIKSASTA
jgi:hypothetical protein